MAKGITVYEVLYTGNVDGSDPGAGRMGDGVHIERFRRRADAERCAAGHTSYGGPAKVQETPNVPRHIASRWGVA